MMHWYLWTYHLYVRLCLIFSAHNWDHCDTGIHACFPIFHLLPLRLASLPISQWFYLDSFSDFDYHISALSIIHIHYHRTRIFSFAFAVSGHLLYTFQFSLFQDYLSLHDFSVFIFDLIFFEYTLYSQHFPCIVSISIEIIRIFYIFGH